MRLLIVISAAITTRRVQGRRGPTRGRRLLRGVAGEMTSLASRNFTTVLRGPLAVTAPSMPKGTAISIAPPEAISGRLAEETSRAQVTQLRIKSNATALVRPKRAVKHTRSILVRPVSPPFAGATIRQNALVAMDRLEQADHSIRVNEFSCWSSGNCYQNY